MNEYIEKYRKFRLEEVNVNKNIDEYRVDALLLVSNSTILGQEEILSNIRSIAGVTRIKSEETIKRSSYYITKCSIKIDTFPYRGMRLEKIFQLIRMSVLRIDKVRRFTFITSPIKL